MKFGYYDIVLGVIPVSMVSVPVMLSIAGLPFFLSIVVGSFVSVALVGHAMFIRPPTDAVVPKTNQSPKSEVQNSGVNRAEMSD